VQRYFDTQYDGPPFELFGAGHLIAVTIVVAALVYTLHKPDTASILDFMGPWP